MAECAVDECTERSTRRGWCQKHYKRWKLNGDPTNPGGRTYVRIPPAERFWAKVDRTAEGCWLWTGGRNRSGYGLFSNSDENEKTVIAHRFAWVITNGPIPPGLHLDHLCRVRLCVNPDHLEPVTPTVNYQRRDADNPDWGHKLRKSHCPQGHSYDGPKVHVTSSGSRVCLICLRARSRARREAERAGVPYRDPWRA